MESLPFPENESKNKLQEFFQRDALPLPTYETKIIANGKSPIFISTVTLCNGSQYQGEERTTKKSSEFSAAIKALINLSGLDLKGLLSQKLENITIKSNIETRKRNVIMIDIENLHNFHKSLTHKEFELFDIYVFVGVHHHLASVKFNDNIRKIMSPSTRPDGTDTCIQVFTGVCLAQKLYDNYFIATRDKFGSGLVDMIMGEGLVWEPKKGRVVTDITQVYLTTK
jgi:hypothetical protein